MHRPWFGSEKSGKLRGVLRKLHNRAGIDVPAKFGVGNFVSEVAKFGRTGNAFKDVCVPQPRAVKQDALDNDIGASAHQRIRLRRRVFKGGDACARFGVRDLDHLPTGRPRLVNPIDLKGTTSLRQSVQNRILPLRPLEVPVRRLTRDDCAVRASKE